MAAGLVVLLSREDQTAYYWRLGARKDLERVGVVPGLDWHAASDLAGEFQTINFGGSDNPSLSAYKDRWGARAAAHFGLCRNGRPPRRALLQYSLDLKNRVYNVAMRVAFRPWQRLRYGPGSGAGRRSF